MEHKKVQFSLRFILVSIAVAGCTSSTRNKVLFVPLTMLNYADTGLHNGKQYINKTDFYLVQNYSKSAEVVIDSFVQKNKDPQLQDYNHYEILFYKESAETNVKNIQANRRVIDRHSQDNDWIFSYKWNNGKPLPRWKIVNGELVEPSTNDIKVEDLPE